MDNQTTTTYYTCYYHFFMGAPYFSEKRLFQVQTFQVPTCLILFCALMSGVTVNVYYTPHPRK